MALLWLFLAGAMASRAQDERLAPAAATLTTLAVFVGTQGFSPFGGLVRDANGNLYGTTYGGGILNNGVIFQAAPPSTSGGPWTTTVLYSFTGGTDGGGPYGSLTLDKSGNLYGAALYAGSTAQCCGVVFQLAPPSAPGGVWTETVLHTFTGSDGINPNGGLVFDSTGALYGTTALGGASDQGVVFQLVPATSGPWTYNLLYSFAGGSDGANPPAGAILGAGGALYGVTRSGGGTANAGVIFKLARPATAGGPWTESLLYPFPNGKHGGIPEAALVSSSKGVLYGTTLSGGPSNGGTVFQLKPPATLGGAWTHVVLHSFSGADGAYLYGGLAVGKSGVLYGTTFDGGASGYGTVFSLSPPTVKGGNWSETVLYSFTDGSDGSNPVAGVMLDASGIIYGTTSRGGPGCPSQPTCTDGGTVFELVP
jgi:uncharacterized repeat protein (TIGR03803 family)